MKFQNYSGVLLDIYSTLLATVATNGTSRRFPHSLLVHLIGIDYTTASALLICWNETPGLIHYC